MYAIVDIAGQQFKVSKEKQIFVNRLEGKEKSKINFDNVLLIENKGKITIGTPTIKGATVSAKIIEHLKADKIIVFKKKRRKGYQKSNGHRQFLTKIEIEGILEKGSAAKTTEKKAEKESPKAKTAKAAPKKVAKPKASNDEKKEVVKKAKPKKATAKKTDK
jgi:large subunit ribosomal protein L21